MGRVTETKEQSSRMKVFAGNEILLKGLRRIELSDHFVVSGSFSDWKENKMSMRSVTRLKVMVLYGIEDQKLQAEGECQILLDEGERGVRQAGRWAAADSSEVWDEKARSERALR